MLIHPLRLFLPLFFGLALLALPAMGQDFDGSAFGEPVEEDTGPVTLTFEASRAQARPGDQIILALQVDISQMPDKNGKTWHIYPPPHLHLKDAVEEASELKPTVPDEFIVGAIQWPKPTTIINWDDKEQPVYEEQVLIYVPLIVKDDAAPGKHTIAIDFHYQPCNSQCIRGQDRTLELEIEIVARDADVAGSTNRSDEAIFAEFDTTVWAGLQKGEGVYKESILLDLYFFEVDLAELGPAALLSVLFAVALLGGLLLNFTPCVLPVIPIKIMGLSQSAGSRGKMLVLGSVMFLGVLTFWAVFGVFFAFLKQFNSVSALFQEWWFTIGVGVIVAAMAVGMCGLFSVRLPRWVYAINPKHDSLHGSFGFGVMTAVLATPCTAPFMGTALAGSTQLEQDWLVMAVFIAIGVGMGLPYLVLAAFPQLISRIPRTGPGSELLKQVMGLLMLAAAAFFIGTGINVVLSDGSAAPSKLFWWVVGALIVAAGGWLVYKINALGSKPGKRIVFSSLGLLLVLSGCAGTVALTKKPPIEWAYYTPEALEAALAEGNVVVLDFTADWCSNCIALEQGVLNPQPVSGLLNSDGVVAMKVDITSTANVDGQALLNEMGSKQIPLLVVLSPDGEQVWKRDWYKASDVVDAIRTAKGNPAAQK